MSSEPPSDDIGSAASWMAYMQRFSSSLQRIEGHCDALAAIDQRASTIMGQVNVVESQIAPILKKQEDMNDLLCQLADRVTAVEQSHLSHLSPRFRRWWRSDSCIALIRNSFYWTWLDVSRLS